MAEQSRRSYRRGAVLTTEHKDRRMKSYLVLDGELKQISTLNGWATLFLSIGTFCLSIAVGIWSGLFVEGSPSEAAKEYGSIIEWTFFGLSIGFFVLAGLAVRSRNSEIHRIRSESDEAGN